MKTMKKANFRYNRYIRETHKAISSMCFTGQQPLKRRTSACFTDDLSSSDNINRLRDIRTVGYGGSSSASTRNVNEDVVALTLDRFTLGDERKFSRETFNAVNINNNNNNNNINNNNSNSSYKCKTSNIRDRHIINKEITSPDKLIKDNKKLKSNSFNYRSPLIENRVPREKRALRREAWTLNSRSNDNQATVSPATKCRDEHIDSSDASVQKTQANVHSPLSRNMIRTSKKTDLDESLANQRSTHRKTRTLSAQQKSMQRLSCGLSSTPVLQTDYGTYIPVHPSYRAKVTRSQSTCDAATNSAPNTKVKRPSTAAAPKCVRSPNYPLGYSTARRSTDFGGSSAEVCLPRLGCSLRPRENISMMIRNGKILRCDRNENEEVDELDA